MASLAIIVIHYRTPNILQTCLQRLRLYAPTAKIFVVDTALQEETRAWLQQHHPAMQLISAPNHSMAHAVNVGLKAALATDADYICHMNADVYIEADTFATLLPHLKDDVAMVAPRAYSQAGHVQKQGFLYRRFYGALSYLRLESVAASWLSGCMQVVTRKYVVTIGGLDSSLRFYNEDMEWCWRARASGWRCLLVNTPVTHLGGSSTPAQPAFIVEGLRGGYVLSQRYRSRGYQRLHRWAVWLWASMMLLYYTFRQQKQSAALYQHIATMFYHGTFEQSPFGASLQHTTPAR